MDDLKENKNISETPHQNILDESAPYLLDTEIKDIVEAVRAQDSDTITSVLEDLNSADTAELLSKMNEEHRSELINNFSESLNPEIYTEMDSGLRKATLSEMSAAQVAELISQLESDDALLLIEPLEPAFQKEILKNLSAKTRSAVEEGLSYPEDSAGRLMRREMVVIPEFWTVGKTIDYLRQAAEELPDNFFDIFIVDPSFHLIGEVPLNRLVCAKRSEKIRDLKHDDMHPIPAMMDQEHVAHMFRRENLISAPVVDENQRLIGMITVDDIVDVIDEEAQEDILRLAGVDQGDLYRAVISTAGSRFRWLFVNLLTAILASIVISFFDSTIEEIVALAVLMPIVASMGGNAGTQALTISVRALATRELSGANTFRVIWKETLVGLLNGFLFAVIIGFTAALWFSNPMLGVVIASAMAINLIFAGFCGTTIPILLEKYGSDPAVSSTVLLTTVTDVVGFLAFLGLATLFLI